MVLYMKYKRNNSRHSVKGRGNKMTTTKFINTYYNDIDKCTEFFFNVKWPGGYCCEKCQNKNFYYIKSRKLYRCTSCHHDESLLAHTCFEQCKLALNILLLGIFLIFTSKNGISSEDLAEELEVNYKTACLLNTKCRILMRESNCEKTLDSMFYESDVAYIGSPSEGKRGLGTSKQPCLVVLSTDRKNQYPRYIKLKEIPVDSSENIIPFFKKYVVIDKTRELTTDGKTTYAQLGECMKLDSHKIDYDDPDHDLWFTNICISNLLLMINGTYHGIGKRELPLYFSEFEYRFNHRRTKDFLPKIVHYIQKARVMTKNMIKATLDKYALERGLTN